MLWRDVCKHCQVCLTCATRRGASHPPLQLIPVGGLFHCMGIDILKLPLTYDGNQYVLFFLDYLAEMGRGFSHQRPESRTCCSCVGWGYLPTWCSWMFVVRSRLQLSLSQETKHVRVPSADGLVERFHRTDINVIDVCWETCQRLGQIPFLHALCISNYCSAVYLRKSVLSLIQPRRSPTYWSSRLSKTSIFGWPWRLQVGICTSVSSAWKTASKCIQSTQKHQKNVYDCHYDQVMVHKPHEANGKAAKLARPYFGLYCIVSITSANAEVRFVDKPNDPTVLYLCHWVVLSVLLWINRFILEWSKRRKHKSSTKPSETVEQTLSKPYTRPITRSRAKAQSSYCIS